MKFEVKLKDAIIVALIIALAFVTFARIAKIEAALQTAVLVKTVNDQGAALQEIVKFLNGKPWTVPPAKGIDAANAMKTR